MFVRDAKDAARRWVIEEASRAPGFNGAFYAGSTNWLPDDAVLPAFFHREVGRRQVGDVAALRIDGRKIDGPDDVRARPARHSCGGQQDERQHEHSVHKK